MNLKKNIAWAIVFLLSLPGMLYAELKKSKLKISWPCRFPHLVLGIVVGLLVTAPGANKYKTQARWSVIATVVMTLIIALNMIPLASADQVNNGCIQEVYNLHDPQNLQCTAEDIKIATATNINIIDPCSQPGDTVTFSADFQVDLTAQARYDLGIYFATDGDPNANGALTGTCSVNTVPYAPDPPYVNLDAVDQPTDTCGDIDENHNPLNPTITITAMCVDANGDGKLDLPYCTSWRQPGDNKICTGALDAYPGAPSKCKCDTGFQIDIPVPGKIIVDKVTLDVNGNPLPNDPTSFSFILSNTTINHPFTLTDNLAPFDSASAGLILYTGTYSVTETVPDGWALDSATCSDGSPANAISLQPGETVTCTFNDKKTMVPPVIAVTKTPDPASVPETGGSVTYTVTVTNTAQSDATLDSLMDDVFNDVTTTGHDGITSTTCSNGATLLANSGNTYSCTFTASISGNAGTTHTNMVTATASNDAGSDTATDDATVTFTDVAPDISMTKTADPTSVPETGGDVVFTFKVDNIGTEAVTLTSLTDTVFGDLNGQGDCVTGGSIPVSGSYTCSITKFLSSDTLTAHNDVATSVGTDNDGTTDTASTSLTDTVFGDLNGQGDCVTGGSIPVSGSYTCSITKFLSSDTLTAHNDVATSVGTDNDGTTDTASDDADVTFTDVPPDISVTKDANPTQIGTNGYDVVYSVTVTNTVQEQLTLTLLTDNLYGDITTVQGMVKSTTCSVPQTLDVGGSYTCSFTVFVTGPLGTVTDVVTAVAEDNDNSEVTKTDDATVTIVPATGQITPTKTTCEQFSTNNAEDLSEELYNEKNGVITSLAPGVFFYYSTITAPSGSFTIGVTETKSPFDWPWINIQDPGQVILWNSDCAKLQSVTPGYQDGQVTLDVTGASAGATYYLSVKYEPASLKDYYVGTTTAPWPMETYAFVTDIDGTQISTSMDSIDVKHK